MCDYTAKRLMDNQQEMGNSVEKLDCSGALNQKLKRKMRKLVNHETLPVLYNQLVC